MKVSYRILDNLDIPEEERFHWPRNLHYSEEFMEKYGREIQAVGGTISVGTNPKVLKQIKLDNILLRRGAIRNIIFHNTG